MSRGTFFASSARSVLSFSCCNKAISASVSARHLSKPFFQLLMSCILFSSFVLLSCWVQRVWLSVSFLRKRLSCRTRCEASRCLSAFVRIMLFEVCQSDTAKRGGILGSVKAIFIFSFSLWRSYSEKTLSRRKTWNEWVYTVTIEAFQPALFVSITTQKLQETRESTHQILAAWKEKRLTVFVKRKKELWFFTLKAMVRVSVGRNTCGDSEYILIAVSFLFFSCPAAIHHFYGRR